MAALPLHIARRITLLPAHSLPTKWLKAPNLWTGQPASPIPCCAAFHATCLQARQTLLHTLQEEVAARRAAAQELRSVW